MTEGTSRIKYSHRGYLAVYVIVLAVKIATKSAQIASLIGTGLRPSLEQRLGRQKTGLDRKSVEDSDGTGSCRFPRQVQREIGVC